MTFMFHNNGRGKEEHTPAQFTFSFPGYSLNGESSYIEAETDVSDDMTSTLSSTQTAPQSIYDYVREHGRSYHRYREGSYLYPNDETEIERMDILYETLKLLFGGKIFFAPLFRPERILDIGTGHGTWAIEMGMMFPDCEVTGTDLSPIQPSWFPENVKFVIDDAAEEDWLLPPASFDYIHTQVLLGSFEDFRDIIRKSFRYLKPGGYMESVEVMPTLYCDDGTMPDDYPFLEWTRTQDAASMNLGKPVRIANKLKRWYERQGFVDVREVVFKLPLNGWPKDPNIKSLGCLHETHLLNGLQGFTLAAFNRGLNWTKDEIEVYLVNVRRAISNRNVHAYHKVYVVWGRKPDDPPNVSNLQI